MKHNNTHGVPTVQAPSSVVIRTWDRKFWPEPLKVDQLDGHGGLFGWRREQRTHDGKRIGDLIHLYVEDDGLWHWADSFDEHWLPDLQAVLGRIAGVPPSELPGIAYGTQALGRGFFNAEPARCKNCGGTWSQHDGKGRCPHGVDLPHGAQR